MTESDFVKTGPDDETLSKPRRSVDLPERIGPYRILEQIGEGGMGIVYLAEQTEPIRRRVALKLIKLGMDTKQVIARFEAERQALAVMDHPCVAKVFDAGVSDDGRSYFVMEHVPGVPITEHCDQQRLSIEQRLKLFIEVCKAIQHAHQKGIIHRDLKPGNILVSVREGSAVPKVIDFGVAKALHQKLTEKTLFTEQGQLIGTPEYMSPEQAEMTAQDIDTRSDIYSLGVLLYELLTGALPFDPKSLREAAFGEIQRIIREVDPPKPSTRLSSMGDQSGTNARNRRLDLKSLTRGLQGDLDWIVMKALEKDRERRYETSNGLAMDIQRHLNCEPVAASPPSAKYRLEKFIQRNRTGVIAASLVATSLVLGVIGTSSGMVWALREKRRADNLTIAAQEATENALEETKRADEVKRLTKEMFSRISPEMAKGEDITLLKSILDDTSKRLIRHEVTDELIAAELQALIGDVYRKLGQYPEAERHLPVAIEIFRRVLGEEQPETLTAMSNLAHLYREQGRLDEAEDLFMKTLEIRKRSLGEEHKDTLTTMGDLAGVYNMQNQFTEAESLFLKTLALKKRVLGEEAPGTLTVMGNLAMLYMRQGLYDEAEPLQLKTLEIQKRVLGEEHWNTLISMSNLSNMYKDQGRYEKAEPLYLQTQEIMNRVLGEEHPDTLTLIGNLALMYERQRQFAKAEPLLLKTLEIKKRVLTEEHPSTLSSMGNLAMLYMQLRQYADAEQLYLKTLEIKNRVLGEEHTSTLSSMNNLALMYYRLGRYSEAKPLYVKTLEIQKRVLGEENPKTLTLMSNLALVYIRQGQFAEAEGLYVKILEIQKRELTEEHRSTLATMVNLALMYHNQNQFDEAERLYLKTLEIQKRVLGEEHPTTLTLKANLAVLYYGQSRFADAEPFYRELLELKLVAAEQTDAGAADLNDAAWTLLTHDLEQLRDPVRALRLAERAVALAQPPNDGNLWSYLDTLALAEHQTGDTAAAIETQKKALSLLPADAPGRGDYEAALAKYEAALENESN